MNKESRDKLTNQLDKVQNETTFSPSCYSGESCSLCPEPYPLVKPRSYSTSRDFQSTSSAGCLEGFSKRRSYSFDAVGRAHKYVTGMYDKKGPEMLITQYGHHSPTRFHRNSTGSDDGIGSSAGSAESMDALPYKRKVGQTFS